LLLNTAQRLREAEGAIWMVYTLDHGKDIQEEIAKDMKEASVEYGKKVKGNPKHNQGSPHIHVWIPLSEHCRDTVGLDSETKAALTAFCTAQDEMDPDQVGEWVNGCRLKLNYTPKEQTTTSRITLSVSGAIHYKHEEVDKTMNLRTAIDRALKARGCVRRVGAPPPTNNERKLAKALAEGVRV